MALKDPGTQVVAAWLGLAFVASLVGAGFVAHQVLACRRQLAEDRKLRDVVDEHGKNNHES